MHAEAGLLHVVRRDEGIGRGVGMVGLVRTKAIAGGKKRALASAEPGRVNLMAKKVVLQTIAAPDLVFVLQIDRAFRFHLAGYSIPLGAVGRQHGPLVTSHEIVGGHEEAGLVVEFDLPGTDPLDVNPFIFRLGREKGTRRACQQQNKAKGAREFHSARTAKQNEL